MTTKSNLTIRPADLIAAADALRPADFDAALRLRTAARILTGETEMAGEPADPRDITLAREVVAPAIDDLRRAAWWAVRKAEQKLRAYVAAEDGPRFTDDEEDARACAARLREFDHRFDADAFLSGKIGAPRE